MRHEVTIFYVGVLLFLISICLLSYALYLCKKYNIIQLEEKSLKNNQLEELQECINNLTNQKLDILKEIGQYRNQAECEYDQQKQKLDQELIKYQDSTSYAAQQYVACLEKDYDRIEREYDLRKIELECQYQDAVKALNKLKNELAAGVKAQLREREMREKQDFYKIQLSHNDIEDIENLKSLTAHFHQPSIISKIIWTSFIQKRVTELCNRILGSEIKTGIYKITNLNTQQCYIGQSVNIGA